MSRESSPHQKLTLLSVTFKSLSTSFDFFHGPVAEVFRKDLPHISFLGEELNHFYARGLSWEEKGELVIEEGKSQSQEDRRGGKRRVSQSGGQGSCLWGTRARQP